MYRDAEKDDPGFWPAWVEPVAAAAPIPVSPAVSAGSRSLSLRHILVLLDLTGAVVGWRFAQLVDGGGFAASQAIEFLLVIVLAVGTVALAGASRLYRARVCSLRSVEIQRLARVVLAVGALTALIAPRVGLNATPRFAAIGTVATFLIATALRGGFRSWLQARRKQGRFLRRVVLVGANSDGRDVLRLVEAHPEAGYAIVGVIASSEEHATECGSPYLGQLSQTVDAVRRSGANGVIIAATAWSSAELNGLVRRLVDERLHIHVSTGMQGIAQSRLRPSPLAYEPLFYVESTHPSPWRLAMKRLLDVTVAAVLLVTSLPVLVLAALAIRAEDGGPVLFRQRRVGLGGRPFTILKLRTMSTDAESRYAGLAPTLAAGLGPLVRLKVDPRVTRVGRFLRASSIDELPQLLNVLVGSMSMVGPRPNQEVETAELDPVYAAQKVSVRPGITGLWQVEARDHPSFEEYRRYDVFYLENWTLGLDAAIMLATAVRVVGRTFRLRARLEGVRTRTTTAVPTVLE